MEKPKKINFHDLKDALIDNSDKWTIEQKKIIYDSIEHKIKSLYAYCGMLEDKIIEFGFQNAEQYGAFKELIEKDYKKDIEDALNFGYVRCMTIVTDKLLQMVDNNEFKTVKDVKDLLVVMKKTSDEEFAKIKGKQNG